MDRKTYQKKQSELQNEEQKRNFEIANRYLGSGDPGHINGRCGLWFAGIEEAGTWDESSINEFKRDMKFWSYEAFRLKITDGFDHVKGGKQVRSYMSKIALSVSQEQVGNGWEGWETYRDKKLWQDKSAVCQINLFPLCKPNLKSWPEQYGKLFGLFEGKEGIKLYHSLVEHERFKRIREIRENCHPQAVIGFGKTFYSEFRELFELPGKPVKYCDDKKIEIYDEDRIILTPFFGNGQMSHKRVEYIVNVLKGWGVSIP